MLALHAPRDDVAFPEFAGAVAAQWQVALAGSVEFIFTGLPAGSYAVAVYHDENGNEELDTNLLGIPREGFAFSGDARGFAGPPSFDDAAVEVVDGDRRAPALRRIDRTGRAIVTTRKTLLNSLSPPRRGYCGSVIPRCVGYDREGRRPLDSTLQS